MMTIAERIKKIRKDTKLNQTDFGTKVGISGSQQGCIETGARKATDRYLNDVCRVFNVNMAWLTHNEGEMYELSTPDMELTNILADIALNKDEKHEKIKDILLTLKELDDEYLDPILKIIEGLNKK